MLFVPCKSMLGTVHCTVDRVPNLLSERGAIIFFFRKNVEPIPVTRCSTAPPACVQLRSASPFHDVFSSTNDKLPPPSAPANHGSAFSDLSSNRKFSPLVPSYDATSSSVGDAALANHRCLPASGPVLRIRNVNQGSEYFHPGSSIQGQKCTASRIRIRNKEFKYF